MPLTTPTPLRVDAPIQLFPRPPSHTLGGARDVAERYEIQPALKWFNVQLVITKGRANALVVWPCVSSVDQSSCLRQTGCNQACHIDHHQALLHHRRSIHHCIGGAGHSLVTDPPLPPSPDSPSKLYKSENIYREAIKDRDTANLCNDEMEDIKGFGLVWQLVE